MSDQQLECDYDAGYCTQGGERIWIVAPEQVVRTGTGDPDMEWSNWRVPDDPFGSGRYGPEDWDAGGGGGGGRAGRGDGGRTGGERGNTAGPGPAEREVLHAGDLDREPAMGPATSPATPVIEAVAAGQPVSVTTEFGAKELAGVTIQVTVDRWGQAYIGVFVGVSISSTVLTGTSKFNAFDRVIADEIDSASVHKGMSLQGGFVGGGAASGISVTDSGDLSPSGGVGTPLQASAGVAFTFIGPIRLRGRAP